MARLKTIGDVKKAVNSIQEGGGLSFDVQVWNTSDVLVRREKNLDGEWEESFATMEYNKNKQKVVFRLYPFGVKQHTKYYWLQLDLEKNVVEESEYTKHGRVETTKQWKKYPYKYGAYDYFYKKVEEMIPQESVMYIYDIFLMYVEYAEKLEWMP